MVAAGRPGDAAQRAGMMHDRAADRTCLTRPAARRVDAAEPAGMGTTEPRTSCLAGTDWV